MIIYFIIGLTLVVTGVMLGLGWRQLSLVRQGKVVLVTENKMVLGELLQRKVDQWYYDFAFFFKQLLHFAFFFGLLFSRRAVIMARFLLIKAERKFSHLIDMVRGKGVIHKKGTVSLFLTQIRPTK